MENDSTCLRDLEVHGNLGGGMGGRGMIKAG